MNKILILSSHTDDAELAAGATMKRLIDEGHEVRHLVFSDCDNKETTGEFQRSMQVLGLKDYSIYNIAYRIFAKQRQEILDILIRHKKEFMPHFVFTHGSKDTNQDHQIVHQESFRAFKTCNLIGYNHPWNQREAKADYFVRIDRTQLDAKLEALNQYESQRERLYFNPEYTQSQAISYGTMLQCGYAEAFEALNLVL